MSKRSSTNPIQSFFDGLAPRWDEGNEIDPRMETLLDRIGIRPGARVLDLACGTGIITGLLQSKAKQEVVGLDLSPKMIEIAKQKYEGNPNIRFLVDDFYGFTSPEPFDFIVLFNAFPHFLSREELAKAFARNLRDGGRFAILHSLGRNVLNKHHEGCASSISRDLLSVDEEWAYFSDLFEEVEKEESETHYFIVGKKR